SNVLTLTNDNFEQALTEHSLLFVKFFTPWCGYCQALEPEYENAAVALENATVTLAQVDCQEQEDLCLENDVQGFPTLTLFRQGLPSVYTGPRESEPIVQYVQRQMLPVVSNLTDAWQDDLDAFIQGDQVVIVGQGSADDYAHFHTLANDLRDEYRFAWQDRASPFSLVLHRPHDDYQAKLDVPTDVDGSATADAPLTWIRRHASPLFGPIGPDNYMDYEVAKLPLAYLFVESLDQLAPFETGLNQLARTHRGKMNFVYIDAVQYPEQADYLGLTTGTPDDASDDQEDETTKTTDTKSPLWPAFVIQTPEAQRFVFNQSESLTWPLVEQYVDQFLAGALTPFLLSDPVPAEPLDGAVQVVVGSQFHELVTRAEQPVLFEVYAPWCGHCKALAPVYARLAEVIQNNSVALTVAKMDGTTNDLPHDLPFDLPIDGYPTVAYIQHDKVSDAYHVGLYEGDRSLADLLRFVEQQPQAPTIP
ncbi:thioredoxin-domain-containing protein, partial [Hesseltinella vesiculosa]